MKDGILQQLADPITIYDHPKNKFVAGFIGSPPMNFMTGRVIKKDAKMYFDEGRLMVKLVEDMHAKIIPYLGKEIVFGIRSEDIYDKLFVSEAPPENVVRVNCEVYEPMGSEVYLYLNTGKHTFIARVGAHDKPKLNQDMDVVFDMSKVHFFDKDTEETIV
jgi:multiple sugar transport system ATP-binding protein